MYSLYVMLQFCCCLYLPLRLSSRSIPPGATRAEWKIYSVSFPKYHCNITCNVYIQLIPSFESHKNFIRFICWYLVTQSCTVNVYMNCIDVINPIEGAPRGDVVKMRLTESYTNFHAIPHGEREADETVCCRWQQRSRFLRRYPFFQLVKINILHVIITN